MKKQHKLRVPSIFYDMQPAIAFHNLRCDTPGFHVYEQLAQPCITPHPDDMICKLLWDHASCPIGVWVCLLCRGWGWAVTHTHHPRHA